VLPPSCLRILGKGCCYPLPLPLPLWGRQLSPTLTPKGRGEGREGEDYYSFPLGRRRGE